MDRRKALLAAAAVVAVLGVVLVVFYVRGANNRAADKYQAVKVLTVTKTIPEGETVTDAENSDSIALTDVPQSAVLSGALTDLSSISKDVALTTLYPGEQIISAKFGASGTSTVLPIPSGMIAVSLSFTDQTKVASFVTPGNNVAIFLNGTGAGGYSRLLLPKVEVVAVGSTATTAAATATGSTNAVASTILTFAVSQQDAEKLLFAQNQGTLSLALVNAQSQLTPGAGVNSSNLFN